jgi:hypothetical protein
MPLSRRLGESRIGEMALVGDPGLGLLRGDLRVELGCHAVELGDHGVQLGDPAALFVHLKLFQPNQIFT